MKAIQVNQTGGPEVLQLVDLPIPQPKANEAVVKIAASGVNFIDIYQREGRYKVQPPFVLGQEGAGTVTAIGADVKSIKVGDRVAWTGILGSYAEYAAVPSDRLVPIPEGIPEQQAAAAMLQGRSRASPSRSGESQNHRQIVAGVGAGVLAPAELPATANPEIPVRPDSPENSCTMSRRISCTFRTPLLRDDPSAADCRPRQ
jgi:D-arabinose 1-dehydrogenase-like Zn-dependent alcohol dehydrogenase